MGLNYELKLSMSQIQMLIAFIRLADGGKIEKLPKGTSCATAEALVREGLLNVKKGRRCSDPSIWSIPRKGYLVANLVKEEFSDIKKLPKISKPEYLFWYDLPPELIRDGNTTTKIERKGKISED